jgi:hypothetical protein
MATGALIEEVAEEVASNLEEVAEVTRRINGRSVGYVLGGIVVGAAVGFYFGYRWNREKIKAEAFKESEAEIEQMRKVYLEKTMAAEPKPSIDELIEEKGYSEAVAEIERPVHRHLPPPVPVREPPGPKLPISTDPDWIWERELELRTSAEPYVIHIDEFEVDGKDFNNVAYTYFAGDDVLVGEDSRPIPHADVIVGQNNLKFGHGSDDLNLVYVRNEHLEIDIEITRTPGRYEQEVLGLDPDESD